MAIIGDRYRADIGVTEEEITFSVTMRDVSWLIEAFTAALNTLANPDNWLDEYSAGLIDNAEDFASELLESITFMDRVGEINAYMVADTTMLPANVLPCTGVTFDADEWPLLYAKLPAALKTETTFTTPDMRGRTLIGAGTGTGLTTRTIATILGTESHILTEAEMPSHTHQYQGVIFNVDVESVGVPDPTGAGLNPVPPQTGSTGGDQAHNNMQPSYVVIWGIIAK